jgi:rod shape determining protein RodA
VKAQTIYKNRIDWLLVTLYLIMAGWGWFNILSTEYNPDEGFHILDFSQNYGRQMFWIMMSAGIAFLILILDARFFSTLSYGIYGGIILILIFVLVFGAEVSGSKSWFIISDSIRFQPSELAKVGVALAISKYLSTTGVSLSQRKHQWYSIALIAFPTLLILLQKDTGTAMVFLSFFLVFYREGWPSTLYVIFVWLILLFILTLLIKNFLLIGILFFIMFVLSGIYYKNRRLVYTMLIIAVVSSMFILSVDYIFEKALRPHQKDRIMILLGKEVDPKGIGYNMNQSLIAIGSGGFTGKGYMKGTQTKFNFVPEQSTDFIFCTIGEEWGFLGSFALIGLFMLLLIRIIVLSEKQRSDYSRIYGYIVASVFFFHFIVNIAMTINLMPVIGIPLPFFSYGGSSMIAFTMLLFIFIKLNSKRNDIV